MIIADRKIKYSLLASSLFLFLRLLTAKTVLRFATELQPVAFSSNCQNALRPVMARAQFTTLFFHTGSKRPLVTGEKQNVTIWTEEEKR